MTPYISIIKKLLAMPGRGVQTFEAFQRLDAKLGHPHRTFRTVHIGGTNGKGSVATKIAEGLKAEGKKVGLYTSPHISCIRERIQVNGEMIPEEAVLRHLPFIFSLMDEPHSYFDVLTALAFMYFREVQVDWAIIEVGIGGRLDATNVIHPDLTVITTIGLDHKEVLGETLEKIAKEKKGIVKKGVPFIAGPHAASFFPEGEAVPPVQGFYDEENSAIAATALRRLGASEQAIQKGIKIRPKCRFEQVGNQILDAAHNPDGFCRLIDALKFHFPNEKFHFIVAFSKEKEWQTCLDLIRPHAHEISFVNTQPRFVPLGGSSVQDALEKKSNVREVICGSFYLMAEARRCLGCQDPSDPE